MTDTWQERCARCERAAPPSVEGPEGQAARGWVTYEGQQVLVIVVPAGEAILPMEMVETIRSLDEHVLVTLIPDPQVQVAQILELNEPMLGLACPACQQDTGWDHMQWSLFLARGQNP